MAPHPPVRQSRRGPLGRLAAAAVICLAALAATADAGAAPAVVHTDGYVVDAAIVHGRLHLVGSFTRVSLEAGALAVADPASGALRRHASVDGRIDAVEPDGSGGVYIAGAFDTVDGVARPGLAHLRADGALDTAFAPEPDGTVFDVAVDGAGIWAVGLFHRIGGEARDGVALLDAATGAARGWRTTAIDSSISPSEIAVGAAHVYVAGDYWTDCEEDIEHPCPDPPSTLYALDRVTGADAPWTPFLNGVEPIDLVVQGGAVFATTYDGAEVFTDGTGDVPAWAQSVAVGLARTELAATPGGDVITLAPGAGDDRVLSLVRPGTATPVWQRTLPGLLELAGVAGAEAVLVGAPHRAILAALADGATRELDLPVARPPLAAATAAGGLVLGGEVSALGGVARRNSAALDLTSGAITGWNPSPDGAVGAIASDGARLVLGGAFRHVGSTPSRGAAVVDGASGALVTAIDAGGDVDDVVAAGGLVWAIGDRLRGPTGRAAGLVAFDRATARAVVGRAAPRAGGFGGLAVAGGRVVVTSSSRRVPGANRVRALVPTRRAQTAWSHVVAGGGSDVASRPGGGVAVVGGGRRPRLHLLGPRGRPVRPTVEGQPWPIAHVIRAGSHLVVTGQFTRIGRVGRAGVALLDARTGRVSPLRIDRLLPRPATGTWRPLVGTDAVLALAGGPSVAIVRTSG